MTDRELLKLAAKAVGYKDVKPCYTTNKMQALMRQEVVCGGSGRRSFAWVREDWNPLTDDGDALRLMAKLQIEIGFEPHFGGHNVVVANRGWWWPEKGDIYASTRRAIVLAAAEIGKSAP